MKKIILFTFLILGFAISALALIDKWPPRNRKGQALFNNESGQAVYFREKNGGLLIK